MKILEMLFDSCVSDTNGVKDINRFIENKGIDEKQAQKLIEIIVMSQRESFEYGFGCALRLVAEAIEAKV